MGSHSLFIAMVTSTFRHRLSSFRARPVTMIWPLPASAQIDLTGTVGNAAQQDGQQLCARAVDLLGCL
jgi:hypothetical protein